MNRKFKIFYLPLLIVTGIAAFLSGCGGGKSVQETGVSGEEYSRLANEYKSLLIRKNLSNLKEPYLIIDFKRNRLELRLAGVAVWDAPMEFISTDSSEIASFKSAFLGKQNTFLKCLTGKHLYSAENQTPDSILAIVAEAIEADPDSLQRHVPERFRLYWGQGLYLEVRTEIDGRPLSRLKNALTNLGNVMHSPFGNVCVKLKMSPEDALTIYRVSNPGMFTLLDTHPEKQSRPRH